MEYERNRWTGIVLAALAAGLLLRLWFLHHAPPVGGDGLVYGGIAKNWLTRGVYGFNTELDGSVSPTLIRLPGYPVFLAACFKLFGVERYSAIRYLQITDSRVAFYTEEFEARGKKDGVAGEANQCGADRAVELGIEAVDTSREPVFGDTAIYQSVSTDRRRMVQE